MSKVTKHVSYSEVIQTKVKGVSNEPTPTHMNNIIELCKNVFEPLREHVGKPIKINSVYRSEAVNKAIKGAISSQHCKGEAMDIDDNFGGMSNNEMGLWIKDNLIFDQLIFEKPINGKSSWIHVSYKSNGMNRKQTLVFDGKKYHPWTFGKKLLSL
jgi:zinc D-Ala-D-Ala carboxypeptidase